VPLLDLDEFLFTRIFERDKRPGGHPSTCTGSSRASSRSSPPHGSCLSTSATAITLLSVFLLLMKLPPALARMLSMLNEQNAR
jgi:hypothetical protein